MATRPRQKWCKRGHDQDVYRTPNSGNGAYCCGLCACYTWDDNDEPLMCVVDDCINFMRYRSTGYCHTHQSRIRKYGTLEVPRGECHQGHVNAGGYREIWVEDAKWQEHRWVMSLLLNRPLLRHESVHHINGVRDDNRPENLELWSTSQPSGQRVEDKVAWAIQFLSEYGYTVLAEPEEQCVAI